MKKVFLLLVLNSLFTCIHAQNFEWTKREGLWEYDYGYGIANDNAGNVYISGKYEMKANFSGTIIPQQGNHDIYVAKYNPAGALIWIRTAGGYDGDYARALACDGSNYVYIAGEIQGSGAVIKFPGSAITLTCRGDNDAFFAKYDLNGNLLWANQAGGGGNDESQAITYDNSGNVYVAGFYSDGAIFGTTSFNGKGGYDMFVAKYDQNGVFQWVRTAGGPGRDEAKSIKCDTAGNVYVCGMYKNGAVFGSQTLTSPNGYFDAFLAKYTTEGTLEWVKTAGGDYDDLAWSLTIDNSNKIYITGEFNAYAKFDNIAIPTTGSADIFVACYDASGNVQWVKKAGGIGLDRARGIGCDGTNLYITGQFDMSANFGPYSVTGVDNSEIFMAKLNNAGDFKWAIAVGGQEDSVENLGYESGIGICAEASGNVYATGALLNGGIFGNTSLNAYSRTDVFLTKISQNETPPNSSDPSDITLMEGLSASFNVSATGSLPLNYQWQKNGVNISGATTSSYSISTTQLTDSGLYRVVVTNVFGNDTSNAATLNVIPFINPSVCTASGSIGMEFWANVAGTSISSIPVNTISTSTTMLTVFEEPTNVADNYGSRIRGYVCPPYTGNYIFWIASDDNSELWLSTDNNTANKQKIASVTGYTSSRQWTKYPSQQSESIYLIAGQKYYIETLHKEGGQGDNCAVGWQLPTELLERPIPGSRLSPYVVPLNVTITSPINNSYLSVDSTIIIQANTADGSGTVQKVEFFANSIKLGEDLTSPYSFTWTNLNQGNYELSARAFDSDNDTAVSTVVNITVVSTIECSATGTISREVWNNISGGSVSSIPLETAPNLTEQLSVLQSPVNSADNYGQRIRGFICPPATGNYVFWIASDDNSELWLSQDDNPLNKQKIASVSGYTSSLQWTKYPTQQSAPINLIAGGKYYIEVLHKEGSQGDNCAVGWQLPDGSFERPIPGSRLSPFALPLTATIILPVNNSFFNSGSTITIEANASGGTGTIQKIEFFADSVKLGEDATSPYNFTWNNVSDGNYILTAKVTDNGNNNAVSANVAISVSPVVTCDLTGTISREVWNNISGTSVSAIPLGITPSLTEQLAIFKSPGNVADNYGQRIRGFVCPPATGNYIFWIASDDNSELWLSTNDNPANKQKIASVSGYTSSSQWTKYPTQQSIPISLTAGVKYYIEALHKEGGQGDNCSVGWQLPNGTFERPIPGSRLSPFSILLTVNINSPINNSSYNVGSAINIQALVSGGTGTIQKVEFFAGSTMIGEDLTSPYSFTWNNASSGAYNLTAKVTDNLNNTAVSSIINITVNPPDQLTTTITSPAAASSFNLGSAISIEASASGGTGPIQKVEFFADSTKIGEDLTSPYSFIWNNASSGAYNLTAKGTDSLNNTAVSSIINITVNPADQLTTAITSPPASSSFNVGSAISIEASASGGTGAIQKVEFFADSTKIGEDETSPYSFIWNNASSGAYNLTTKVTDSLNNTAVSSIINITVNPADQLTTAITSPPASSSFNVGSAISIEASASGGTGAIQKVEFFADSTKIGEDLTSPYSFIWNNASSGAYNLTAKVTDSLNNIAVSSIINITVNPANQLTTTITSPTNTTTYPSPANITINATATSSGGSISKVEFFQGDTKIGETFSAPYSFTWMNVNAGNYTLTAIATDNSNQTSVSQPVNITVTTCPTPVITPSGPTTMCSGSVTLHSTIGTGYLYQWKKDGVNITGATNSSHIATVTGSYQVKIIQGSCISWSAPESVKIQSGLRASITPGGPTTFCTGGNVNLYGNTCSGFTYQWKKDGAIIQGATSATYVATTFGSYQLQVTQAGIKAWSALVTVTVNACRESDGNSNEEFNALPTISETTGPSPIFQMQVFPNPNTGLFTILLNMPLTKEEKVKMRIVNLLGQEVYNKEYITKDNYIKEVVELDKSLPSGIYTLQVMIGNKVENTSVVLSR